MCRSLQNVGIRTRLLLAVRHAQNSDVGAAQTPEIPASGAIGGNRADRSGSRGSHFGKPRARRIYGKEALTGALIEHETTILLEEATAALEAKSGYDALQRLIAAAVKHQFRRPALALILDFEARRWPLAQDIRMSPQPIYSL